MLWIILGVIAVLLVALVLLYNRLVTLRNRVENAWAQVDVELKRRYDLIPNLVETVKGYAAHERDTLDAVITARTAALAAGGSPEQQSGPENALVDSLKQLLAVSERYPDLKANDQFLALQRELVNTEDRIQAARRFYNGNVRDYNRRVESVPSNIV